MNSICIGGWNPHLYCQFCDFCAVLFKGKVVLNIALMVLAPGKFVQEVFSSSQAFVSSMHGGQWRLAVICRPCGPSSVTPPNSSSYTRSQPAGDTLLAWAPRSVPSWAMCKMKPDRHLPDVSSLHNVSSLPESLISRWSQPCLLGYTCQE